MKSNQPAFIPLEDSEADENSEFNHQNKGKKNIYLFREINFTNSFLHEMNKLVLKQIFFLMV